MRLILVLVLMLWAGQAQAATLYVNNSGSPACSDATAKASNSAGSPWCTIGRAAWGNATRATPNSGEAAAAGDVVAITGGTYDYSGVVDGTFDVLYNPTNEGTAGNLITFSCIGDCTLTAEDLEAPVAGASAKDYVKWYADISLGYSFIISACAENPLNAPTEECGAGTAAATPDTGPVVCADSTGCWIEGFAITGSAPADWDDNWSAVRLQACAECMVRNNVFANFTHTPAYNHNHSFIILYGVLNSTIEHNQGTTSGSGVYFKNTGTTSLQSGNIVRFNAFVDARECVAYSLVSAGATGRNWVYQNTCSGGNLGIAIIDATDDWIVNNTFYNQDGACLSSTAAAGGSRFWNNICVDAAAMVYAEATTMPADTVLDSEHNAFFTFTNFYTGTDGNRTFANYKATYTDQDAASPASINSDPLLVNTATGDFRICTGSGAPVVGCAGASPALAIGVDILDLDGDASTVDNIPAGAYVTGNETIGLDTDTIPPSIGPTRLRIRGEN